MLLDSVPRKMQKQNIKQKNLVIEVSIRASGYRQGHLLF
jgi:hypothetical protein